MIGSPTVFAKVRNLVSDFVVTPFFFFFCHDGGNCTTELTKKPEKLN